MHPCVSARGDDRLAADGGPGGGSFAARQPGEPYLFKRMAPYNAIGGFGLFARFAPLPVWRACPVTAGILALAHGLRRRRVRAWS